MSVVVANKWENIDGTENYKCRAWVNFDGTGTVTIRDSGNVSSITDNGVSNYTINFDTPMPDGNYVVSLMSRVGTSGYIGNHWLDFDGVYSAAAVDVRAGYRQTSSGAGSQADSNLVCLAVFR